MIISKYKDDDGYGDYLYEEKISKKLDKREESGPVTRNTMLTLYRRTYTEKEAQRRAREFMKQQHNIYRRSLKK